MAINSLVQVYNLALNAIGSRDEVSLPTEQSREAEVCTLWYSPVRDQVLASAVWPEATEMAYLAQINLQDDDVWAVGEAKPGYAYSYAAPADILRPQYMSDFTRFMVAGYDNQRVIYSNTPSALLIYTRRLENIALWGPELQMAIVYALAAHICMPLTGKPSRSKMLIQQANELVLSARETAANQSNEQFESIPDWILARGYSQATSARYFYPLGGLLSVANVG